MHEGAERRLLVPAAGQYRERVRSWVDANWLRVAGYAIAALAAFLAGVRERRRSDEDPNLWPTFWFLNAALLLVMAIGRAADVGGLITTLGRSESLSGGWYANRR